jgi:hypothetical protein
VRIDDAGDVGRLRLGLPLTAFESPAEDDSVGPREHVTGRSAEGVINLGLGEQNGELAAHGHEFLVAEQGAGAEAGSVKGESLGQRKDVARAVEAPDLDPAAGDLNVPNELAQEAAGLDIHGLEA